MSGTYTVGVACYCDTSAAGAGPAEATVRVYCAGTLIDTVGSITIDETGRWVTVAEVDWPGCAFAV